MGLKLALFFVGVHRVSIGGVRTWFLFCFSDAFLNRVYFVKLTDRGASTFYFKIFVVVRVRVSFRLSER